MKIKKSCLLFLSSLFVLSGCNLGNGPKGPDNKEEGPKPADFGYGASVDGVKASGEWAWKDGTLASESLDSGSKIFKDSKKENLSLSFDAKVVECTETVNYSLGGYVYYKDSENNVKFTVDKSKVTLDSVKGLDTQSSVSFYPSTISLKEKVTFTATKNGDLFEFYMGDVLITSLKESFEGEGQFGFATDYAKVEFSNVKHENYAFASKAVCNSIYTPADGMPGTWEIDGAKIKRVDDDPETACYESVVFNSAVATNYNLTATVKFNGAIQGGYNLYGIVAYYRNATNYVIVFFNGIYVDVLQMLNGVQQWTGGVETPNRPDSLVDTLYCEKVGSKINIFANDTYIRTLESDLYNAPGSIGVDINGALAEFEIKSVNTIDTFSEKVVDKGLMTAVNYPHLLARNENKYTTIEATSPNGANYGGTVYTHAAIFGNEYEYEVTLDTTYLTADPNNNSIGIMGGTSASSQISLLLVGNGYMDLFGIFNYKDDQGEDQEVNNTWFGQAKLMPEECFTEGVINTEIHAKVSLSKGVFTFSLEGIEVYKIEPKTFNICWPGIIANYVGASFIF